MIKHRYEEAVRVARGWARDPIPYAVALNAVGRVPSEVGVYFACQPDGRLDYVGSSVRRRDPFGIANRVRAHPPAHLRRWGWVWLMPLALETPEEVVLGIEAELIARFRPPLNQIQPQLRDVPRYRSKVANLER